MLRCAGLFSGIGGFALAAEWMGWVNVFEVEIDAFCRQVLIKNFGCVEYDMLPAKEFADIVRQWRNWKPGQPKPPTVLYADICKTDLRIWAGLVDVLCGGFPCQPYSSAGKGLGTADPRHLWPQYLRIIREVRPPFVVGENVRGLLSWAKGLQFEAICAELEAEGYEVQPLLLPAASVGAPHHRDRVWFVAHAVRAGWQQPHATAQPAKQRFGSGLGNASLPHSNGHNGRPVKELLRRQSDPSGRATATTDAPCGLCQRAPDATQQTRRQKPTASAFRLTEPGLRRADDGIPTRLVRAALKAYGNAIVPQVAYQIFQAIQATLTPY